MELRAIFDRVSLLRSNLCKVLRGKQTVVDLCITALLARGHILLEDVPGVGKTTLAHGLARSINSSFHRIQFTSDLLPSDVIGVTVYNQSVQAFEFKPGPIFANVILADEINRATPKTQSALLEAMNDGQVSVDKATYGLPKPFMLLATQNPIEYSGTFPLPESQLDRFLMCLNIGYPDEAGELDIIRSSPEALRPDALSPVITASELLDMQEAVQGVRVEDDLGRYMVALTNATRTHKALRLGVSPRGTMALYRATQAHALVNKRDYAVPDDVKALAIPVFSHRVVLSAQDDFGSTRADIIGEILCSTRVPV